MPKVHIINRKNLDLTLCGRDFRNVCDYVHPEMHPKTLFWFTLCGMVCKPCGKEHVKTIGIS